MRGSRFAEGIELFARRDLCREIGPEEHARRMGTEKGQLRWRRRTDGRSITVSSGRYSLLAAILRTSLS